MNAAKKTRDRPQRQPDEQRDREQEPEEDGQAERSRSSGRGAGPGRLEAHGPAVYDASRTMAQVTRDDVLQAAERIRGRVHRTPTFSSGRSAPQTFLKAELFQRTGSFKARGVLNKLASLTAEEKARGVIGDLRRKPRAGARLGCGARRGSTPRRHVRERERGEGRGDARLRRRRRPRGGRRRRGVPSGSTSYIEETGRDARSSVRRPARDRGPGNARARDPRGRAGRRDDRRADRRRRARRGGRGGRGRTARVIARRAGALDRRARRRSRPASRCASTPGSIADGLNAPFAGGIALATFAGARRRERARHARSEIEDGLPLPLRAREARLRAGRRRGCRGGARREGRGRPDRLRRLGRERLRPDRRCYPGPPMKADIHPDYVLAHVTLLVRQRVLDALDEGGAPRRDLRRVPPVLHGQAEARRHRRSGGALPAPAREGRRTPAATATSSHMAVSYGGQAVLEGVMMRSPSSWAVAVRTPEGEITEVVQDIELADAAAQDLAPAGRARRHRARRVARDRLPRARDLRQRRLAGARRGRRDQTRRSAAARSSSRS